MKEYDVKITETLEKTVTVQAESHDAAEEQVRAAYYNSEYILDSENFTGVAFGTTEEREVAILRQLIRSMSRLHWSCTTKVNS